MRSYPPLICTNSSASTCLASEYRMAGIVFRGIPRMVRFQMMIRDLIIMSEIEMFAIQFGGLL